MDYKHKTFYHSQTMIDNNQLDEFKKETIDKSYNILLEQKYKNNINHREPTNKSLEWIMKQCIKESNIIITDVPANFPFQVDKFQVVYFHDWYFAWVDISPKYRDYFVIKYDLEKMK